MRSERKWRGSRLSNRGLFFFFQAEDGIRDLVRSRGLGDVYKRHGTTGLASMLDLNGDGNPLDDILGMAGKLMR